MKERKDECLFCSSRSCYSQIFRDEEPKYDEVFCEKHINEGYENASKTLNEGIHLRTHRDSTGKLSRGDRLKHDNHA